MAQQSDLFNSQQPLTLIAEDGRALLYRRWLTLERSNALLAELESTLAWHPTYIQLYGKRQLIPRLNAWYGDSGSSYRYSGAHFNPRPWTIALGQLRDQLEQETASRFNSVLANYYRDGRDSVAWHSDNEPELGPTPTIASLSIGAARDFVLRHKQSRRQVRVTLQSGDLLIMAGQLQRCWQHQLPKTAQVVGPRINLTYRRVSVIGGRYRN